MDANIFVVPSGKASAGILPSFPRREWPHGFRKDHRQNSDTGLDHEQSFHSFTDGLGQVDAKLFSRKC